MENNQNEEIEIDLREIFFALKRRILLILAVGLFGGLFKLCLYHGFCKSYLYFKGHNADDFKRNYTDLYGRFAVGSTAYQRLSDFNYQYACFGTGH